MLDSGESQKEAIRPDFNRSIMIDFQGATISSDTGFILLREIDERFKIIDPMKDCLENLRSPAHTKSVDWLIKRLIKVGARVSSHARRWYVHVASAFPLEHHYRAVLAWGL
jgi:hypothetical protein